MTRKMKAILVLFFAAEIVNSAKVGVLKGRIADLETQRDIYASRAQNWLDRAVEDEEVIDSLQIRLPVIPESSRPLARLRMVRRTQALCSKPRGSPS